MASTAERRWRALRRTLAEGHPTPYNLLLRLRSGFSGRFGSRCRRHRHVARPTARRWRSETRFCGRPDRAPGRRDPAGRGLRAGSCGSRTASRISAWRSRCRSSRRFRAMSCGRIYRKSAAAQRIRSTTVQYYLRLSSALLCRRVRLPAQGAAGLLPKLLPNSVARAGTGWDGEQNEGTKTEENYHFPA